MRPSVSWSSRAISSARRTGGRDRDGVGQDAEAHASRALGRGAEPDARCLASIGGEVVALGDEGDVKAKLIGQGEIIESLGENGLIVRLAERIDLLNIKQTEFDRRHGRHSRRAGR